MQQEEENDELNEGTAMIEENELEAPAYLDPDDQAIEVHVNDDDDVAPMDDEEEEEEAQVPEQDEMSSRQIQFHTGPVYAVAQHQETILSGGGDDRAGIHNATSQLVHQATDSVAAIAVCADYWAIGSYDGRIIVVSTATAAEDNTNNRIELDGPTDIEWLSFHPTGSVLLAGSTDGTVWMYSVRPKAQCMQVFVGHEGAVTAGSFLFKVAVTCAADGSIRIWAPKTGLAKCVLRCSELGLTCLAVGGGADGKLVLAGGEDGMAYCCHIGSQKIIHRFEHTPNTATPMLEDDEEEVDAPPLSVEAVGFSPANTDNPAALWCATGGVDGVLKIWDVTSGQCRHVCRVDDAGGITRLQWIEQHYVVTCGTVGVVRIWDARSGTLLQTLTAKGASVMNDMTVSVDDAEIKIVTGSDDNIVRVFVVAKALVPPMVLAP